MFSGFYQTVRAFVLGFAMLTKRRASDKFGRHKARVLSILLLAVYYSVQWVQYAYHGKAVPKEHLPDTMNLLFQLWMIPVLYLGFYQVVLFMCREDVQRALSSAVAAVVRVAAAVWHMLSLAAVAGAGRAMIAARYARRALVALAGSSLRIGALILRRLRVYSVFVGNGAFTMSVVSLAVAGNRINQLKQFASHCIEAGQKPQA
ncbi:hypothetical protein [Burkholderia cenocepacia]|uniref:hypothetical protein n=1 Tax=Burkholderia cenocepacia TaxID=95486 RepID=UPI00076DDA62|nr:hypothetical protein [Burkholderia cenocepacia]KWU23448.1 hypothetical protein AS149_37295 [Burkholderia cenocepacia]